MEWMKEGSALIDMMPFYHSKQTAHYLEYLRLSLRCIVGTKIKASLFIKRTSEIEQSDKTTLSTNTANLLKLLCLPCANIQIRKQTAAPSLETGGKRTKAQSHLARECPPHAKKRFISPLGFTH